MKTSPEGKRMRKVLLSFLSAVAAFSTGYSTTKVSALGVGGNDFLNVDPLHVVWKSPFMGPGSATIAQGQIQDPHGNIELRWSKDLACRVELLTLDPSGSGELPQHDVVIWPVPFENGTVLLVKAFFPLLNSKRPLAVIKVGIVESRNLLAPLGASGFPETSPAHQEMSQVSFGGQYEQDEEKYQKGSCNTDGTAYNFLWKKEKRGSYSLFSSDKGAGYQLIPLFEGEIAFIFEKRDTVLNGFHVSYLRYCGKMIARDLFAGFEKLK